MRRHVAYDFLFSVDRYTFSLKAVNDWVPSRRKLNMKRSELHGFDRGRVGDAASRGKLRLQNTRSLSWESVHTRISFSVRCSSTCELFTALLSDSLASRWSLDDNAIS